MSVDEVLGTFVHACNSWFGQVAADYSDKIKRVGVCANKFEPSGRARLSAFKRGGVGGVATQLSKGPFPFSGGVQALVCTFWQLSEWQRERERKKREKERETETETETETERAREREPKEEKLHCTQDILKEYFIYTHIYIYTYIKRGREIDKGPLHVSACFIMPSSPSWSHGEPQRCD